MTAILVAQLSLEAEQTAIDRYRLGQILRLCQPTARDGWLDIVADQDLYDEWLEDFGRRQALCNESAVSVPNSEVAK